jgi:hypothetical protein
MFKFLSSCRFARVAALTMFTAVLMASISTVWATTITYNIVDYPNNQAGSSPYTGTAHVTGSTITVDTGATTLTGTGISIPFSDITAATVEFQTSLGSLTIPIDISDDGNSYGYNLMASATQLYFNVPTKTAGQLALADSDGNWILYYNDGQGLKGGLNMYEAGDSNGYGIFSVSGTQIPNSISLPGQYIGSNPMIIGTAPVPEPSSLALLGIGAVSLLAYAWRQVKVS